MSSQYERFGPFIIIRALGRGGMGEVYVARTRVAGRPLAAVKRLRPDVARVPTFAERFQHEADLAVRLEHPNVVGTIDVGSVENQLYVASDLILGKDTGFIADRLRERGLGAPVAVVIRLLLDILEGVSYVHGVREPNGKWIGLIHRDVTPGNVLVGYDGKARLADFGLAKSALMENGQLTGHGEILGTPHYLAPEVIRGEAATRASDIYGLGAVMYRVLTGVPPHQGTTAEVLFKALNDKPARLSELRPDLPGWFVDFVHTMLETEPKSRPGDAALLANKLRHEASSAKLLLQSPSVGRWLGQLFEEERVDEESEAQRIREIDPGDYPEPHEGTVVLARVRPGTALLAPPPVRSDDYDDVGTDHDLSHDSTVQPSNYDENAEEDLRTWAIPFGEKVPDTPSSATFDEHEEGTEFAADVVAPTRVRQVLDPADVLDAPTGEDAFSVDSGLPGFADSMPDTDQPSMSTSSTADDSRTVAHFPRHSDGRASSSPSASSPPSTGTPQRNVKHRPRNPESVVVGPASVPPGAPVVSPAGAVPFASMEPAELEDSRESPGRGPASDPMRSPQPRSDPKAPSARSPRSAPDLQVTATRSARTEPFIIALLAAVFISVGVGLGFWISDGGSTGVIQPEAGPLRARFDAVHAELKQRKAAGRPMQKEWSLLGEAAAALLERDEARAKELVDALERALSEPRVVQEGAPSIDG